MVVRENVEDLYAGIEYMQTPGVAQALKLISDKGSREDRAVRVRVRAERGAHQGRVRDQGQHHEAVRGHAETRVRTVAPDYPELESWHVIVDNAAHQLVKRPEQFDVIVTTNMNGDILSDLSSALIGGLGFAPSANVGNEVAIFEAVHGSAPKYAGKNVINPTAVILSSVLMLRYLGFFDQAAAIEHAVFVTLESGVFTGDVLGYDRGTPTTDYTNAIIGNLGKRTETWTIRDVKPIQLPKIDPRPDYVRPASRSVVGLDVFVESPLSAAELGASLMELTHDTKLSLKLISSRGTKVFPPTGAMTETGDHFRCRFIIKEDPGDLSDEDVHELLVADLERALVDAHREAAGVRRRARVHAGPGRGLGSPSSPRLGSGEQSHEGDEHHRRHPGERPPRCGAVGTNGSLSSIVTSSPPPASASSRSGRDVGSNSCGKLERAAPGTSSESASRTSMRHAAGCWGSASPSQTPNASRESSPSATSSTPTATV